MSNDSDSFIQEVDQSLREERMLASVRRLAVPVIGVFAAFILGLIGWQWYAASNASAARAQSDTFSAAQQLAQSGQLEQAKTAFEGLTEKGPQVYRLMAHMELAAVLQSQGDLDGAVREFDAVAAAARDPVMRDTAVLRAAYIIADTKDFDTLRTRLQPLVDSRSRLAYPARELLAIEAWKAGDLNLARETLENLTLAFDAPRALQQRAQAALSVIGPAPPEPAPPAAATPAPAPAQGGTP